MTVLGLSLVSVGLPVFAIGSVWMFSGKPILNKKRQKNLEEDGALLLMLGCALLFIGIGFL